MYYEKTLSGIAKIIAYITTYSVTGIIAIVFLAILYSEGFININNPFDYVRATEIDYRAVIVDEEGGNGKVIVTERITFEIHAFSHNNRFWELWRALPEKYVDGVKVDYQVLSVKQIITGKEPVYFTESPKLYWNDRDFTNTAGGLGPGKWFHSKGPYNEEMRQYECVLIYVDGLYRETVVFEIEYEINNAVLRYDDCTELYLTLYSESAVNFLKSFKGQIMVPLDKMPRTGNYDAFTYGTNSHSFPFNESTSKNPGYHTFYFALDKSDLKFRPYNQYIEFVLLAFGSDKHKFSEHASVNRYYYTDKLSELRKEQAEYEALPARFKTIKRDVFFVLMLMAFLVTLYVMNKDKIIRNNYLFFTPAQDIKFFRDIPSELDPKFAATLVFCKHKSRDNLTNGYSAVLLSLVHKGYISLKRINESRGWEPHNINIIVNRDNQDLKPPSLTEAQYFNLINRHVRFFGNNENGILNLKLFQQKVAEDYEFTEGFVKHFINAIKTIGVSQKYFQKADYHEPRIKVLALSRFFSICGALILFLGNFISYRTRLDLAFGAFFLLGITLLVHGFMLKKKAKRYVLLTQFGEDEYAKWRGLYEFLDSETLMSERNVPDLVIWEQYLIYATAFGIAEKVTKALAASRIDVSQSPILSNGYYRSSGFRSYGRSFGSATRTASYSSGSGGHGGYGGGGRGGGGAGGGH